MKKLFLFIIIIAASFMLPACKSSTPIKSDNAVLQTDLQKKHDINTKQHKQPDTYKDSAELSKDNTGKQSASLKADQTGNDQIIKSLKDKIAEKDALIITLSTEKAQLLAARDAEISRLTATNANVEKAMQDEIKSGELKVKQKGNVLDINFMDRIFFESGKSDITIRGEEVLDKLVTVLKDVKDRQIRVEGYTDNVPIAPKYQWKFPSNWELSTTRATTIVRYLQSNGINPAFLKATGYGEYNPIVPNKTDEGRSQNRRIVIVLVPIDRRSIVK